MKAILYCFWQWTWGLLQSLIGAVVFLLCRGCNHYRYHGAVVTCWKNPSSVSLGMFVFLTEDPYFAEKLSDHYTKEELSRRLLVHEYGHTIQSLILGPLYLIVMGIPSTLWGFLPAASRLRKEKQVSYFAFFTERWANALGERVTGEKSMEQLKID